MPRPTSFLWDYFIRDDDDAAKKAQCRLCLNFYSYLSTTHNLLAHLQKKHEEVLVDYKDVKLSDVIWEYFTQLDQVQKKAKCNVCEEICGYKQMNALITHLEDNHSVAYNMFLESLPRDDDDQAVYLIDDEASNDSNASASWGVFERQTGGRVRCGVCRVTLSGNGEALKRHLREAHPKLASEQDSDNDAQGDKDEDVYTEVVYLEDESSLHANRTSRSSRKSFVDRRLSETPAKSAVKRIKFTDTRNNSGDGMILKSKKNNEISIKTKPSQEDEIDKFGNYVICLLKSVPKDVSTKLQMDIINLIMTEKLKSQLDTEKQATLVANEAPSFVVFDSSDVVKDIDLNSDLIQVNKIGENHDKSPLDD